MNERGILGLKGEDAAARYLEAKGMRILDRRWRTAAGEIDLVADDGGEVVFVEVKTRMGDAFGAPEESVTARKRRNLRAVAAAYLEARGLWDAPYRIDVVAVMPDQQGMARLRHLEGAVEEE